MTQPPPSRTVVHAESRTVTINGLACHYLEWGRADAPAVLLLHGLRSYAHTWDPVAEALAGSFRVIAPDFRGRGESAWDPERRYFTDTYVDDLESLVGMLGLRRISIVGHSMGGTVGYVYTARHPEQVASLFIEDIGPGSSVSAAGAQRILSELASTPASFDSLRQVGDYWRALRPDITEDALSSRVAHTIREGVDGRWHWALDMTGIGEARRTADPVTPDDLWRCVEQLRCPTLVARGESSDFLSEDTCREMAARQPRLRWTQVPHAGHYVHDDNPVAYVDLLVDFLTTAAT